MTERHTFAIADLGGFRVAVEAAAVLAVEARGVMETLDVSRVLGLGPSDLAAEHVLCARVDGEEVGLAVSSVVLRDFHLRELHGPPRLIARAMNRTGLVALLDLGEGEWAFVLDVAALTRAAKETG